MTDRKIVANGYSERGTAYEAFSRVKQSGQAGLLTVHHVLALERDADGILRASDGSGTDGAGNAVAGGVIGRLVGVLGGPFGTLFAGTDGAVADVERDDEMHSALCILGRIVGGAAAVIADVTESNSESADRALTAPGGAAPGEPVLRRPAAEVQAEVDAASEALAAARREADRVLWGKRHAFRLRESKN